MLLTNFVYNIKHFLYFRNLDETTRSVYKENVRLTEALGFRQREANRIRKENQGLKLVHIHDIIHGC